MGQAEAIAEVSLKKKVRECGGKKSRQSRTDFFKTDGTLFEETEGNLESPLGAPRITEQPRRRGSSARYVRDPMAQDYRPRVVVDHGAQDPKTAFSSPGTFLFLSFEVAVMVLELTRCRRLKSPACVHMMCIANGKQRRSR